MLAVNGLGVEEEDGSTSGGRDAVVGREETPPTGEIPCLSLSSQRSMTERRRDTGRGAGSSPADGPSSSSKARFVPAVGVDESISGGWKEKGESSNSAGGGAAVHPGAAPP